MPRPVVASLLVLAAMTVGQANAQVDSYLSEADVQRFQGIANGTWVEIKGRRATKREKMECDEGGGGG